jgi:hypothetical protein
MAPARASSPGQNSCSTSKAVAWRTALPGPLVLARWAFGTRSTKYTASPVGHGGWVQKTANVLAKLPQDLQAQATQRLQAIWLAPDRQRAEMAFALFRAAYEAKYPKAAACLAHAREG